LTRFKELRRIKMALEQKNEVELKWALEYCQMRIGIAGQFSRRADQEKHWRKIQREVEETLIKLDSNSK
jgi:hypothetical protein